MSLVTACPSCGVFFKVSPDQLLISEGWVRCGKCQAVFDANLSLQPSIRAKKEMPAAEPGAAPGLGMMLAPEPEPEPEPELAFPLDAEIICNDVRFDEALAAQEAVDSKLQSPVEPFALVREPTVAVFDSSASTQSVSVEPLQLDDKEPAPAPNLFSRWRQSLRGKALHFIAALLLIVLSLQVILFERNQIASREPRTKPWLQALCIPFECRLETLKQIKSFVIDSSTFSKIRPDIYQLTLVLKNTSPAELSIPSVELTLINSLEQSLLRRVFQIEEMNVTSKNLAALSELPLLFTFSIKTDAISERVAGYRVRVFYP